MKSRKSGAIVLAATKDLMFAVGNLILGISKCGVREFQTVIIIQNNSEVNRIERDAILLIAHEANLKVLFMKLEDFLPDFDYSLPGVKKFVSTYSKMPLVKLFLPKLFNNSKLCCKFDHVIWLDCDICIVENFDSILDFGSVCGCAVSLVKDVLKNKSKYPYLHGDEYKPNGGVILYKSSAFNFTDIDEYSADIVEIVDQLAQDENLFLDELAIILACSKNNITFDVLPQEYNYLAVRMPKKNPKIIHSVGKKKFWNDSLLSVAYPQWERQNITWLQKLIEVGLPANQVQNYNKSKNSLSTYWTLQEKQDWQKFWRILLSSLEFSNSSIWLDPCCERNFIQFFVKGIPRRGIHFEITSERKNEILNIAFHIERDVILTDEKFKSTLQGFAKNENLALIEENNCLSVELGPVRVINFNLTFDKFVNSITSIINCYIQ